MDSLQVIWRPIQEVDGKYEVSNDGRVRNAKTKREMRQRPNQDGYMAVNFWFNNKVMTRLVHRLVIDAPKGILVDHKNSVRFDNREDNLRLCSSTNNARHRKPRKKKIIKYKGVYLDGSRWRASIYVEGKHVNLGSYHVAENAALAYDNAARKYFGEFAWVNYPIGET